MTSVSDEEVGMLQAAAYDSWFDSAWGRYAFAVEAHTLLQDFGTLAGRTLLDVGCGSGRFTALFEAYGARATGLDLDPSMLALAGQRLAGRLLRGDAHRLPFPDRSFDISVAITVLEFVADPALVIAEMARVTRPGGRLAIGALNPLSPWGLAHRRRLREGPWSSAHFIRRAELRRLGARHGRAALRAALYTPGAFSGLEVVGPFLEVIGRAFPVLGAFQVLSVDLP